MREKFSTERRISPGSLFIALFTPRASYVRPGNFVPEDGRAEGGRQNLKVVNFQGEYSKRRGYYSSRRAKKYRANNSPWEIYSLNSFGKNSIGLADVVSFIVTLFANSYRALPPLHPSSPSRRFSFQLYQFLPLPSLSFADKYSFSVVSESATFLSRHRKAVRGSIAVDRAARAQSNVQLWPLTQKNSLTISENYLDARILLSWINDSKYCDNNYQTHRACFVLT